LVINTIASADTGHLQDSVKSVGEMVLSAHKAKMDELKTLISLNVQMKLTAEWFKNIADLIASDTSDLARIGGIFDITI